MTELDTRTPAERTADVTLKLVATLHALDRARTTATLLEAENHQLVEAAQQLIDETVGRVCNRPDACCCPYARLTRLLTRP